MKRIELEGMCELAKDGRLTWVENLDTHDKGRVISCTGDKIEVDVGGRRAEWKATACREMTFGYKVNYEEVKKHPHEFDTHLD